MNWKIIFLLSLTGVVMAFAGVIGLPGRMAALLWMVIFLIYAVIIVRGTSGRYFLHAFYVSLLNGLWTGIIHVAFISTFLANHHVIRGVYKMLPLNNHRRVLMFISELMIGVALGIFSGLITFAAGRIARKREPSVQTSAR